jgi:hypothetical protein
MKPTDTKKERQGITLTKFFGIDYICAMATFLGAIKSKSDQVTKKEFYTNKMWTFKLVGGLRDIPRNGRRYHDVLTVENGKNEIYELFRTPAGVVYGFKTKDY